MYFGTYCIKNISCFFEHKSLERYTDPYFIFKNNIILYTSSVVRSAGKYPFWSEKISLVVHNENFVNFICYDYQIEDNDFIASSKIHFDLLFNKK